MTICPRPYLTWANKALIALVLAVNTGVIHSETKTLFSEVFTLDTHYKSMQGPAAHRVVYLSTPKQRQLLWITGVAVQVISDDVPMDVAQQLMCHVNIDFDVIRHRQLFPTSSAKSRRLITLTSGFQELQFPDGFGIPLYSDEPLTVHTQVLNHNLDGLPVRVKYRIEIHFLRDDAREQKMQALFMKSAHGLVVLEGPAGHYRVDPDSAKTTLQHVETSRGSKAMGRVLRDDWRSYSGHWIVPPGEQTISTVVTNWLNIPNDTSVHFIAMHAHPYAASLELIDLTTQTSLYQGNVEQLGNGVGLKRLDFYSSSNGIPVLENHDYQLISRYNNTSNQNETAMSVMYLYMKENLDKP